MAQEKKPDNQQDSQQVNQQGPISAQQIGKAFQYGQFRDFKRFAKQAGGDVESIKLGNYELSNDQQNRDYIFVRKQAQQSIYANNEFLDGDNAEMQQFYAMMNTQARYEDNSGNEKRADGFKIHVSLADFADNSENLEKGWNIVVQTLVEAGVEEFKVIHNASRDHVRNKQADQHGKEVTIYCLKENRAISASDNFDGHLTDQSSWADIIQVMTDRLTAANIQPGPQPLTDTQINGCQYASFRYVSKADSKADFEEVAVDLYGALNEFEGIVIDTPNQLQKSGVYNNDLEQQKKLSQKSKDYQDYIQKQRLNQQVYSHQQEFQQKVDNDQQNIQSKQDVENDQLQNSNKKKGNFLSNLFTFTKKDKSQPIESSNNDSKNNNNDNNHNSEIVQSSYSKAKHFINKQNDKLKGKKAVDSSKHADDYAEDSADLSDNDAQGFTTSQNPTYDETHGFTTSHNPTYNPSVNSVPLNNNNNNNNDIDELFDTEFSNPSAKQHNKKEPNRPLPSLPSQSSKADNSNGQQPALQQPLNNNSPDDQKVVKQNLKK